jgi:CRISPR system Cascade subunit CasB
MHALVASWIPLDQPDVEWAYYTVAAMIAAQPPAARDNADQNADQAEQPAAEPADKASAAPSERVWPDNLGRTLAVAVTQKQMSADGTEKRLHLLTRQPVDGLHRHLPALVRHLRTDRLPVNWVQLLDDLSRWRSRREQIAKRWLQSYYRTLPPPPATTTDSAEE